MGCGVGASLSAPRFHVIDSDAARRAAETVRAARAKGYRALPGQVGVTRYIRDVCRNGVAFSASRAKTARGTLGLTLGRQTDHMLRLWVDRKPLGRGQARTYLDSVATALQRHKLMPVTTQLSCGMGNVKTDVDLVCVSGDATGKRAGIVLVELKTTRQTLKEAAASYEVACLRQPRMRHPVGMANTEANAHALQAGFGARAVLRSHPEIGRFPVSAAVLFVTRTGSRLYTVDLPDPSIFDTPYTEPPSFVKGGARPFPLLPTAAAGGALIRATLKAAGHTKIKPGGKTSGTSVVCGKPCLFAIERKYAKLTAAQQKELRQRVNGIAAKAKVPMAALIARDGPQRPWRCATWATV